MKTWNFFRAGGVWQTRIDTPDDIDNLEKLDRKLWAALACPVEGMNFDPCTLAKIDSDHDGFIRVDEVISAVKWTRSLLKDRSSMFSNTGSLSIDNIDDSSSDGNILKDSAKKILSDLGKSGSKEISLSDVSNETAIFAGTPFNADGIITALSCDTDSERAVLEDVIKIFGSKKDRSGLDGTTSADLKNFYSKLREYEAWLERKDEMYLPLFEKFSAVESKLDDFFIRCEIIAFQPDSERILKASAEEIVGAIGDSADSSKLEKLPAARPNPEKILRLSEINPAYLDRVSALLEALPREIRSSKDGELSVSEWEKLKKILAPARAWNEEKMEDVSLLGDDRVREILSQNDEKNFERIFEREASRGEAVANMEKVERLVRFNANLVPFLRNFVNFSDFYSGKGGAAFQFGKLFIDRKECDLCVKVNDVAKHAAMAPLSYACLLYCVCRRADRPDFTIAAAVTSGDSQNLIVGRNGIFYDKQGLDWNATIIKIVENPIEISQAFWAPYKRFVNWATEQIAKFASGLDADVEKNLRDQVSEQNPAKKIDVGTVAALGVAISGLTAVFGMILNSFFKLGFWMPLGIVGVILAISLPSVLIAAMKLKNRNLGPLLDANGWAVNTLAKISIPFGGKLTKTASLPKDSLRYSIAKLKNGAGPLIFIIAAALLGWGIFAGWRLYKEEVDNIPPRTELPSNAPSPDTAGIAPSKK